ncbi:unnamed protein product [Symbiodinium natans]|uniref:Uncharacterized protein n=1 Tax=Symbiodinium natans TaxID=878477 RepID=A0A812M491_9DINO|nr:unnamed protein product [Symbiodinium natans]
MRRVIDPAWECGLGFGEVKRSRTDLRLPWEEPIFSFVASDRCFLDDVQASLLDPPDPVALPTPVLETAKTSLLAPAQLPQPKLRRLSQWKPQDSQAERQAALSKWSQLLRAAPHFFTEAIQLEIVHENMQIELGNFDLRFAKKSTNTLLNRVSSLQRFAAWALRSFPHEPLAEALVFLYCQQLSQKQTGSSAPDQLCQALNFAGGTLEFRVPQSDLVSARVQGLAHQCMRQQKPPQQAPALTADQVRWLQTVVQSDETQYERYMAATFLFMIYARARHSDIRRSKRITVDRDEMGNPVYIECSVLNPKQSKASRRRNLFLPLVAPAVGICEQPWAVEWLSLREHLGLVCDGDIENSPLLPELAADGGLLQVNMDSATASRWLRCLLSRQPGSNQSDLLKFSSQGLKATCLSWCMKYAIADRAQTLLGYHSLGKSASAISYGRDALAGPLRTLETVLTDIRQGKFKPDSTRSGRWQTANASASASSATPPQPPADAQEPTAVSDSDSSAEDLASEGSSGEDTQLLHSVSHSLALVAGSDDFQFLTNVKSGIVHISRREADRLLCGRTVFSGLKIAATVDFSRVQACLTCQSVAEGLIAGEWACATSS